MAFCPICKGNHDAGYPCFDRTGQILRDIGIEKKTSPEKIKKLSQEARKAFLIIGIIALLIIVFLISVRFFIER